MIESPATIDPTTTLGRSRSAIVIHTALRRELRLAGPLVRAVAEGDLDRAGTVAAHLDIVLRALHHHHENEDELVFPLLAERCTGDEPAAVVVMQEQHVDLENHLDAVESALPRWSSGAASAEAEVLARALDKLHATLVQHLDLEERTILPMADRLLTHEDWEAIARHGEKGAQGREKLLVLGILAYEADPMVLDQMLSSAPLLVRKLLPRLAMRRYRRHAALVHGTPTP